MSNADSVNINISSNGKSGNEDNEKYKNSKYLLNVYLTFM